MGRILPFTHPVIGIGIKSLHKSLAGLPSIALYLVWDPDPSNYGDSYHIILDSKSPIVSTQVSEYKGLDSTVF